MGPVVPVIWLDAHPLCWDQTLLDDVLSGRGWPVGYSLEHYVDFSAPPTDGPAIVILSGQAYAGKVAQLNESLQSFRSVLVIITSDEERLFPVDALAHANMRIWLQYPGIDDDQPYVFGCGYTPHARDHLLMLDQPGREGWFFSGQVNNSRRRDCTNNLDGREDGELIRTPGFSRGLSHAEYLAKMSSAKVVPCPSGPNSVDSMRLWEALEAGAIPLVDTQRPAGDAAWYISSVLGEIGPPTIDDWADFAQRYQQLLDGWPSNVNRLQARWQFYKRRFAQRIRDAIRELSGLPSQYDDAITVLIPTSPIASHPSTAIIEQTIESVRELMPSADIIVMCDGVRAEQEHYRERYERYLNQLTWLANHQWHRVLPVIFDEHLHQAEMTRRCLDMIETPLLMFVEHDTPLVTDEDIDLVAITAACLADRVDLMRLHHEALVLPDHEHLMLDSEPVDVMGCPAKRTVQWSQRPHVAQLSFYRRIVNEHFVPGSRGMIEDVMHGVVHSAWRDFGKAGWDRYRLWLYTPPGGNIKRSYTTDGRGDDPKWVDS